MVDIGSSHACGEHVHAPARGAMHRLARLEELGIDFIELETKG